MTGYIIPQQGSADYAYEDGDTYRLYPNTTLIDPGYSTTIIPVFTLGGPLGPLPTWGVTLDLHMSANEQVVINHLGNLPGVVNFYGLTQQQLQDAINNATVTQDKFVPTPGGPPGAETYVAGLTTYNFGPHSSLQVLTGDTRFTFNAIPENFMEDNRTPFGHFLQPAGTYDTQGDPYTGPVKHIDWQKIDITTNNINMTALVPNTFMHTGSGEDAIQALSGTNVLDGGTGSNFLVAGSGHKDTFYVDDRNPTSDVWSTIVGAKSGDNVDVWGLTKEDFQIQWTDNQGAPSALGLTLHALSNGPTASLTMAGFTTKDLNNGKLQVSFGHTQDLPGLPGSAYMTIHVT